MPQKGCNVGSEAGKALNNVQASKALKLRGTLAVGVQFSPAQPIMDVDIMGKDKRHNMESKKKKKRKIKRGTCR